MVKKKIKKQSIKDGYTDEVKNEAAKIKKLTKSKIDFRKEYAIEKERISKELGELEKKRNAEAENLKKLVKFVEDQ